MTSMLSLSLDTQQYPSFSTGGHWWHSLGVVPWCRWSGSWITLMTRMVRGVERDGIQSISQIQHCVHNFQCQFSLFANVLLYCFDNLHRMERHQKQSSRSGGLEQMGRTSASSWSPPGPLSWPGPALDSPASSLLMTLFLQVCASN